MSDTKLTVIYFTVTPLSSATNGGNIASRNHVIRLNRDPNINLRVLAAPTLMDLPATKEFLESEGIEHIIIPRREGNFHQRDTTFASTLRFATLSAVYFPWELEARYQPQYDEALHWAMRHWSADMVVIDYVFTALFCPQTLRGPIKTAIVTFNREEEFYRDMIELGLIKHDRISAWISAWRLRKFEHKAYRLANKIIALSENDLPRYIPGDRQAVITPYLDPRPRWTYSGTNTLFFVGNIAHYPNREAIDFIATKLAPLLADTSPSIRIRIVGASPADVPAEWHHPQIEYLGFSDMQTVEELFKTCDAMISPIKNTYGLKFKMAEAVAYGTPMISSEEALQCLPYVKGVPAFAFGDVQRAAAIVSQTIGNRDVLNQISQDIILSSDAFIASQKNRWFEELLPVRS